MKVESHSGKDDWKESCREYKTTKTIEGHKSLPVVF
jgi:hypothetical protein